MVWRLPSYPRRDAVVTSELRRDWSSQSSGRPHPRPLDSRLETPDRAAPLSSFGCGGAALGKMSRNSRRPGAMSTDLRPRFARKPEAKALSTPQDHGIQVHVAHPGPKAAPPRALRSRASEPQMAYLLHLMDKHRLSRDEVNVLSLTRAEAAGLIHDLIERDTRLPCPSSAQPHPAFVACSTCGVRTCDHAVPMCPGGHPDGPCSWRPSCWNCASPRPAA